MAGDGPRAFMNNIGLGGLFGSRGGGGGGQQGSLTRTARTQLGDGDTRVRGRNIGTGSWGRGGGSGHRLGNS